MNVFSLSWRYLWSRPLASALNLLLLTLGLASMAFVLIAQDQIDHAFERDLAGIDVVVGAKGSPLQLILAGVFHMDVPPGNVPLAEVQALATHPQVAQVAIQQGKHLAKNLKNQVKGEAQTPFKYHDKGSMAIIGKNKAVVDLPKPKMHFKGLLAWLMWLFIHLMSLITLRNRVVTFWNWMISYFSMDQPLRMIIRPEKKIRTAPGATAPTPEASPDSVLLIASITPSSPLKLF